MHRTKGRNREQRHDSFSLQSSVSGPLQRKTNARGKQENDGSVGQGTQQDISVELFPWDGRDSAQEPGGGGYFVRGDTKTKESGGYRCQGTK